MGNPVRQEHLKTLNINELNIGFNEILLTLGDGVMDAKLVAKSEIKK